MKYIYIIFILSLAISCNIDEVYVDVYDPVQDRIDSMEQRKTDKKLGSAIVNSSSMLVAIWMPLGLHLGSSLAPKSRQDAAKRRYEDSEMK